MLTSIIMVYANFGKHGIVLDLRLPQWGAVVRDQYQLSCRVNTQINTNHGEVSLFRSINKPNTCTHQIKSIKFIKRKKYIYIFNLLSFLGFWEQSCNLESTFHSSSQEPTCCWCSHESSSAIFFEFPKKHQTNRTKKKKSIKIQRET